MKLSNIFKQADLEAVDLIQMSRQPLMHNNSDNIGNIALSGDDLFKSLGKTDHSGSWASDIETY